MTFGEALELMKRGGWVTRQHWRSKVMHVSYFRGTKHIQPCLAGYTVYGTYQAGWTPTQEDMFADDWEEAP